MGNGIAPYCAEAHPIVTILKGGDKSGADENRQSYYKSWKELCRMLLFLYGYANLIIVKKLCIWVFRLPPQLSRLTV